MRGTARGGRHRRAVLSAGALSQRTDRGYEGFDAFAEAVISLACQLVEFGEPELGGLVAAGGFEDKAVDILREAASWFCVSRHSWRVSSGCAVSVQLLITNIM